MKNNDLIAKLKKLGEIKPDEKFLKNNRELLLSQISNSGAEKISAFEKFILTSENLARVFSRPAFALGIFVLVLVGANFSDKLLQNTKPNDSLYLARIISEKVKVNTTMNQTQREKLAISYAMRHAEDIASILSDDEFNVEENYDQVAKLNTDFINEVNKVETRLSRLSASGPRNSKGEEKLEEEMIIADKSKDNEAISIYIAPEDEVVIDSAKASATPVINDDKELSTSTASSSLDNKAIEEEIVSSSDLIKKEGKVYQAKELAQQGDFSGALNKLNEAVELIK